MAALGLLADPSLWPFLLGAVAANHLLLALAGMWPRGRLLGPNLARLPPALAERGLVALTFDDGPDPAVTPLLLDMLDRHGAKASFFCIGERARAAPDLVREIVARGHSVENHTCRHALAFACFGMARMRREIVNAQMLLHDVTGHPPRFFRPPAGIRSPLLDPVLAGTGLRYVSWTRRGFDCVQRDPDAILRGIRRRLRAGDIVLLHDGSCARTLAGVPVVLEVLPRLLDHLAGRKLRAVSLRAAEDEPRLD